MHVWPRSLVLLSLVTTLAAQTADVPLKRWTNLTWPNGVDFGFGYGIAVGDFYGDGWPDVYQAHSGNLWRNVRGTDWRLHGNLAALMPPTNLRYSSSFADYDRDGFNDIAIEPYLNSGGDACLRLLRNLPDTGTFVDVAGDPAIIDRQPCGVLSETICWGDVDGDGWLDFVLPTYPSSTAVPGNFFFKGLGPTGPGGAFRFTEITAQANLKTTPWCVRPEGAHFADVDRDGDLDFYCNGTLYQNVSTMGVPSFLAMTQSASGILDGGALDEGALLCDYDLDGDLDLVLELWLVSAMRLYENRGDGTFFETAASVFDLANLAGTGLSVEDWDNDGDLDISNQSYMRRNQLVETAKRRFTIAVHDMPDLFGKATPCWLDWDKDGDLDCVLGKHGGRAIFYENTLYGPTTPPRDRRYVRVRIAADGLPGDRGLETEFGARVEVVPSGIGDGFRRSKVVSSSAGYLNQNEYVLHFGLPASVPFEQQRFDLIVDFPSLPSGGIVRIDRHVNPALGGIALASLADREITVLRSGRVVINGTTIPPAPGRARELVTTNGTLSLSTTTTQLPAPVAVASDSWVGLAFDTMSATGMVRIEEVVLDGQLDAPIACAGETFNLALFEIRDAGDGRLVPGSGIAMASSPRNSRTFVPVDWLLPPGGAYRVFARMSRVRLSNVSADHRAIDVHGALGFRATQPCTGLRLAAPDPTRTFFWLRYTVESAGGFVDFGRGIAGSTGVPELRGSGALAPGEAFDLRVARARPSTSALLVVGETPACAPFLGGVLVPFPDAVVGGFQIDAAGALMIPLRWPSTIRAAYFQLFLPDPAARFGVAGSNAVMGAIR